jgi:AcrR family transcriptional regulator
MGQERLSERPAPLPGTAVTAAAVDDATGTAAGPDVMKGSMTADGTVGGSSADGIRDRETARQLQKEQRLAERGDRILDALARLITRWGYGKTTVDDIAREAGVAKGTVYLHWPTKGAMLQALIEREEQQWNAVVLERMAADPRGGTISSIYRHSLTLSAESPLLRALLTQDRDALGEWTRSPQIRARSHRRMEALHTLILQMRAEGLVRTDIAVEVQAYLIAALSYGILTVDEYLPADLVPPFEEIANAFAIVVRRGLEPEMTDQQEAAALARGRAMIAATVTSLTDV